MLKCYVGSVNRIKIAATKEVLKQYEVVGVKVDSQVKAQPLSDQETLTGALNRATTLPKDGLRIGLEAGVQMQGDLLFMVNWGVLIDQFNHVYYAGGTRIPLPEPIKIALLNDGKELADVIDEYTNTFDVRQNEGAIGVFTSSLVKRKDIFTHIVKLLYGQYLRGKEK
jgi:inosine/xanthosine triphosphatase